MESNTSAAPPRYAPPAPPPATQAADTNAIRTQPVDGPDLGERQAAPTPPPAAGARAVRIGLMLPLRSAALAAPADALRAGFMAAFERDQAGFEVHLIETGDSPQETLSAYRQAVDGNDIIVGPLARSAVSALAASDLVSKPTIALNHPEVRGRALPANMLIIGLSIEDEARQVADWAAAEQTGGAAMIITGASAWQRRIANSFAARWKQLGYASQQLVLADTNGYLSEAALAQLRGQIETAAPVLLFAALDPSQAGQVRAAAGTTLPFYATSSVNPGADPANMIADLVGVRLLDLPWEVQPGHAAAMVYPRWSGAATALDLDRLYALGIDSFRVAREMSTNPGRSFTLDGVTGALTIDFGKGPARFQRVQRAAIYQGGGFSLIGPATP
ncbi:penicillin-binding protein activator [Massilia sp. DWR3-1-1]|uniref:penicillin-binding protein activator n=1 Tax=Massilia sp. DWR3-1-1 TaxID=2804559 RepID=UPI003CEE2851